MPDDLLIRTVTAEGERDLDQGWDYLPYGIRTLKLFLEGPEGLDLGDLWVRPLHRPGDPNLIVGHEDGGDDLWLSWGGGDRRGYHLEYDRGERFVYFQVAHRAEVPAPAYPLTLVVENRERELARATVELRLPSSDGEAELHPLRARWRRLDEGRSEIRFVPAGGFAGAHVPEYQSRWWPTRRVTYRQLDAIPDLRIEYQRVAADPFGAVHVFLDDRLMAQVTGRLEVALHDLRLFSADLFHFHGGRYWVLRLWFQWLHTAFTGEDLLAFHPADERTRALEERAVADARTLNDLLAQDRAGEEVPDAERFDLLIDAQAGMVKYMGTDLHWQELWGPAEGLMPVQAEIMSFGLPNILYSVVTYLEGAPERLKRGETFDPSQVLLEMAEKNFPVERFISPPRVWSLPAPPQSHVPRVEGLSFRDELTSGHVKKGRTPAGALPFFEKETPPAEGEAGWTVMVYLAGDNGRLVGDPLQAAGYEDLREMKAAGSTDAVHLVAQFDTLTDKRTYRYYLQRDTDLAADVVEILEETNAGDPANLVDFVAWAARTYPAERYLLVLWNHGNGWDDTDVYAAFRSSRTPGVRITKSETRDLTSRQRFGRALFRATLQSIPPQVKTTGDRGILYDDTSMDFLDNVELQRALAEACQAAGVPAIDVLGMDACLMNMLEVAYQVRQHCQYLVGSEEVGPAAGWPYDRVLAGLSARPTMTPAQVAQLIVSEYLAAYDTGITSPDVTQSALSLQQVDELAQAVSELAGLLTQRLHEQPVFEAVAAARGQAQTFRRKEDYVDLRHFARLLRDRLSSEPEVVAAADAVLAECAPGSAVAAAGYLGAGVVEAGGVTVYFPRQGCSPEAGMTELYRRLDFAQEHRWLDFLLYFNAVWQAYSEGRPLPQYQPEGAEEPTRVSPPSLPAEGAAAPRPLTVRIVQGSITDVPCDVAVVNHFQGMDPGGAERAVDQKLGGAITYFARQGSLGGHLGELFWLPTGGRLGADDVCVVGLGEPSEFGAEAIRQVGRNLMEGAAQAGVTELATIVHGAGTAGVDTTQAVNLLLEGVAGGLRDLDVQRAIQGLTLVEIDPEKLEDIRAGVRQAARRLAPEFQVEYEDVPPLTAVAQVEARLTRARAAIERAREGLRLVTTAPAPPPSAVVEPENHYYLEATYSDEKISYTYAGALGRAQVPVLELDVQTDFVRDMLQYVDEQVQAARELTSPADAQPARPADREHLDRVTRQMRNYLLPQDLQIALDELDPRGHLTLRLDSYTAQLPWELMAVGDSSLCLVLSLGRSMKRRATRIRVRPTPARSGALKVLIIADPAENLPGAAAEGEELAAMLERHPRLQVKVWQVKHPRPVELHAELQDGGYHIVHYAGHAVHDPREPDRSAWILNADGSRRLTAQVISRLEIPPLLVFSNACQSGAQGGWSDSYRSTHGLADAFLLAGAHNYVGTFWRVNDEASRLMAHTFYARLLDGCPLGVALRDAREDVFGQYGWADLAWGSYMLYGDPALAIL